MFLLGLNFVFGRFCQGRLINLLPVFVVVWDYLNVLVHSLTRVLLYCNTILCCLMTTLVNYL